VQSNIAWAVAEKESHNPYEVGTPMTHAELCRHAAIVGELACAAANPLKIRHFYLALKSDFKLSGDPHLEGVQRHKLAEPEGRHF
jgi:hypothetical protein